MDRRITNIIRVTVVPRTAVAICWRANTGASSSGTRSHDGAACSITYDGLRRSCALDDIQRPSRGDENHACFCSMGHTTPPCSSPSERSPEVLRSLACGVEEEG